MVGILVHGDNHFIVRGPLPDRDVALALVRHWSLIQIGATTPPPLDQWHIITREFRENLEWAIVVSEDGEISPAVTQLLDELSARGSLRRTIVQLSTRSYSCRRRTGIQTRCRPETNGERMIRSLLSVLVFGLFGIAPDAQDATPGGTLYKQRCVSCHGDGLEGRSGEPMRDCPHVLSV
jgi:hypothetical protein